MKPTSVLLTALIASLACGAAVQADPAAKRPGKAQPAAPKAGRAAPRPIQAAAASETPIDGGTVYPLGAPHRDGPDIRGTTVLYDTIGACGGFNRLTCNPAALFDDGNFTGGPAAGVGGVATSIHVLVRPLIAMDPINLRVTFWDTVTPAGGGTPVVVQSNQLVQFFVNITGTPANTTPGLYNFNINTSTLPGGGIAIPDNDFGFEIAFLDAAGNILPLGQITTDFPGNACRPTLPAPGGNMEIFWMDNDNGDCTGDGIRYEPYIPGPPASGDAAAFAPTGPLNAIGITLTGHPNVTAPTGRCCVSGGCSVRTQADCTAAGGTYGGDSTSCGTPGAPQTFSHSPNLPIPDNTPAGVSDTITVPGTITTGDVNIGVNIPDHTYIGDLRITITHGSTTRTLWNGGCGAFTGLSPTFDDEGAAVVCASPTVGNIIPVQSLGAFDGTNAGGAWTINVSDNAAIDTGTLVSWSVVVSAQSPTACGPACPCDWNNSGGVNSQDFFDFLTAFFAGNADYNHDGLTNSQDFFDFLTCFFAPPPGC